jgi:hypothetical protein
MKSQFTTTMRGAARRALLPAIAALALFGAMPAAQADQQETNAEIDNATNWQAARGADFSDGHAQASRGDRIHVRHHMER